MADHRFYVFSPGERPTRVATVAEALAARDDQRFLWLDFCNPGRAELDALAATFALHPLSVEDCFDAEQIPKIDDLPGNTFILFNAFRYDGKVLSVDELDIFLGRRFLITVHRNDGGRRLIGRKLEDKIALESKTVGQGPDFLLQAILDQVVDEKFATLEALQDELDAAEDGILGKPEEFRPDALLGLRRNLLVLRKSLFHEREILARICRRDSPFVSDGAIYHFRDVHDHLSRFYEMIEICRELIATQMETYLSLVNNRMSLVANQTNRVMKRLTLVNTIFMPLTLLAGIGGMSEWSMMTGAQNWRVSYPLFLLLMAVIAVVNYLILRWVDRRAGDGGV